MGAIYRREMSSFFTSGLGYVFLTVFYAFSGYFFFNQVIESGISDTSPMFESMFIMFIFLIPVLTMRLISEEKKNRTDQGLLTAPISLWELVLGKYLAAFTLFVIAESIIFVYAVIIRYLGDVVWSTLLGNYFAMLILGGAFIAIGLFVSSLTENQMTSAVASFVVMLLLYYFDENLMEKVQNNEIRILLWIVFLLAVIYGVYRITSIFTSSFRMTIVISGMIALILLTVFEAFLADAFMNIETDKIQRFVSELSFRSRYVEFTKGVFNATSILFFISTAFLFNFFTVKVIEKRRWS